MIYWFKYYHRPIINSKYFYKSNKNIYDRKWKTRFIDLKAVLIAETGIILT